MFKVVLKCILFCLLMYADGQSQSLAQSATSAYSYYPPQEDKESWQRLNLLLSSTFIVVANEGQIDLDSCLNHASRSLGLSRYSILAEGIGDPDLFEQSKWIDQQNPGIGIRLLSKGTGKKHLQLLILVGSYYAFQSGSYDRHNDSAAYFLTKAINESKTLKEERLGRQALCLLGKIYLQINDPKGDSIYNLLISQCRQTGDKETEARAFVYRSRYTPPMVTTLQRKIDDSQQAANIYNGLGSTEGEINALTDIGYLLTVTGRLQPAKE
ncbi:MAG TPA: hypothetical protein VJU78_13110, partial [Chitinophagaceae bacterium]|nr:hypothetical protein [Chitinophagaceae bacterium]